MPATGIYISQSDVEASFGTVNVAQWSSFTEGTSPTADEARIQKAINYAEARADGFARSSQYAVPIVNSSGSVPEDWKDICSELAGVWLWKTRGLHQSKEIVKQMNDRYKDAMLKLFGLVAGTYNLDASGATVPRVTVPIPGRR